MRSEDIYRLLYPDPVSYSLLQFELLPIIAILGTRYIQQDIVDTNVIKYINNQIPRYQYYRFGDGLNGKVYFQKNLLPVFGYKEIGTKKEFEKELKINILALLPFLKNNPEKNWASWNMMKIGKLSFILSSGATLLRYNTDHLGVESFEDLIDRFAKESKQIRENICPIKLTRYFLNGSLQMYWFEDKSWNEEQEILVRNIGTYLDFISKKTGMEHRLKANLCAMCLAGMRAELTRENALPKEQKVQKILPPRLY